MGREALTGLPGPIERRLVSRYGRSAGGRIRLAAAVKALTVLVKRHPGAAFDMAASAAIQASRVGVQGITERLERLGDGSEVERLSLNGEPIELEAEEVDPEAGRTEAEAEPIEAGAEPTRQPRRALSRRERREFLRVLRE